MDKRGVPTHRPWVSLAAAQASNGPIVEVGPGAALGGGARRYPTAGAKDNFWDDT